MPVQLRHAIAERYAEFRVTNFPASVQDRHPHPVALLQDALNFGDDDQMMPFTFDVGGTYREELHGHDFNIVAVPRGGWRP